MTHDSVDCAAMQLEIRDFPWVSLYPIAPEELVFEECVRLNCYYCKKYDSSWRCPPRIPHLNYQKLVKEYAHGIFAKIEIPFSENDFPEVRTRSTNELHRALLKLEEYLWEHNFPMAVSFIGGSCKLCKNGCGKERCNNPGLARMPMEATGINVVKSAEKVGIRIVFPPKGSLVRLGMLLW